MPRPLSLLLFRFFFFNDTATTEIYTLSLHDALPISLRGDASLVGENVLCPDARLVALGLGHSRRDSSGPKISCRLEAAQMVVDPSGRDRKSTRLNSSHT